MGSNPQTAVAVIEQSPDAVVEWNLDNWPVERFNRLMPTQTLGLATEFIRPLIVTVQLDIEADTYTSRDLPQGTRAPNARGLAKIADAAGVNFVDEVRLDDGSNPNRAYVRVYAEVIDATGLKRRAPGSRDYVLDSQPMTDAQRARAKGYVHEHAATRARHRALRALLSLKQSYTLGELAKPFAVARYVPNTQHPEIREAYKTAMVGAITALYGPEPARQITAGPAVEELAEIADDEPRDVSPDAPATPTMLPGEKLAAAGSGEPEDAMPAWASDASATGPDLFTKIRDTAAAGGMKGPAQKPQIETLSKIFAVIGGRPVNLGLKLIWPDVDVKALALTGSQAQAIINAARSAGDDPDSYEAFATEWRATVEAAA